MAIYRISDQSEIDDKLQTYLRNYFFNDIGWDRHPNFSKHGKLNIGKVHPFARLLSDTRRLRWQDVMPSISIAMVDDNTNDLAIGKDAVVVEITQALVQELEDQKYSLNRQQVFRDLYKILDAGTTLYGLQTNRRYQAKISMEIWADSDVVKDALYEGTKDMLDFYAKALYDDGAENITVTGKKDGDYNFDFGVMLYGSNVTMTYVIANMTFYIDTEVQQIASINHYVEQITGFTTHLPDS